MSMAEFAGVATRSSCSASAVHSVPLARVAVWFLAVKGNYKQRRKDLSVRVLFYVTYIISGIPGQAGLEEAASTASSRS